MGPSRMAISRSSTAFHPAQCIPVRAPHSKCNACRKRFCRAQHVITSSGSVPRKRTRRHCRCHGWQPRCVRQQPRCARLLMCYRLLKHRRHHRSNRPSMGRHGGASCGARIAGSAAWLHRRPAWLHPHHHHGSQIGPRSTSWRPPEPSQHVHRQSRAGRHSAHQRLRHSHSRRQHIHRQGRCPSNGQVRRRSALRRCRCRKLKSCRRRCRKHLLVSHAGRRSVQLQLRHCHSRRQHSRHQHSRRHRSALLHHHRQLACCRHRRRRRPSYGPRKHPSRQSLT